MPRRVVLAMSGGVDSSVAAHLLKQQGHEVIGLFMRTGGHDVSAERRAKTCCSASDAQDARAVADRLDIPFYVLDFQRDFGRIMDDFADEYHAGRTPNPCVRCNVWLKFGRLWDYGRQVGADFVATGHHSRLVRDGLGRPRIARGIDAGKDQSYVLFGLDRDVLPRILLPVGELPKDEVRRIARELNLPVHAKADSQEICFVPDDDYLGFVRRHRPGIDTSGPIVDEAGREVARHDGIEGFTVGQRRGLGVTFGAPRYVVQIEPADRRVVIGTRDRLLKPGLRASRLNWHVPPPAHPVACLAQIRSQHRAVAARVEPVGTDGALIRFDTPQAAVTPGQVVTLYDGPLVLGGGWIDAPLENPSMGAFHDPTPENAPIQAPGPAL